MKKKTGRVSIQQHFRLVSTKIDRTRESVFLVNQSIAYHFLSLLLGYNHMRLSVHICQFYSRFDSIFLVN